MLKRLLVLTMVLASLLKIQGQETVYTYFFDKNFKPTDSARAHIFGKGVHTDPLFTVYFYAAANHQLIGIEQFTDSTLFKRQGSSILVYPNEQPRSLKSYQNNMLNGPSIQFDAKGRHTDSAYFVNNRRIFESKREYHPSGQIKYLKTEETEKRITTEIWLNTKGIKEEEIYVAGTKGFRTVYHPDGTVQFKDSIGSRGRTGAKFPGGNEGWKDFLNQHLNRSAIIRKGIPPGAYTVLLKMDINEKGTITDIKVISLKVGYGLEEESVRVMQQSPPWTPAKNNDKPIRSFITQAIHFNFE